jgi:hypothetical protein
MGVLIDNVYAAPAPKYIAVNDDSNLCSEYWPGDEFNGYSLPDDWRILDEENFTPKECKDIEYVDEEQFSKDCCELIGYEYVESIPNLNSENYNKTNYLLLGLGSAVLIVAIFLIVRRFKRK